MGQIVKNYEEMQFKHDVDDLRKEITLLKSDSHMVTHNITKSVLETEIARKELLLYNATHKTLYVDLLMNDGTRYYRCSLYPEVHSANISDGTKAKALLRGAASVYIREEKQKENAFWVLVATTNVKQYTLYYGVH